MAFLPGEDSMPGMCEYRAVMQKPMLNHALPVQSRLRQDSVGGAESMPVVRHCLAAGAASAGLVGPWLAMSGHVCNTLMVLAASAIAAGRCRCG
jgi:hypothetical protein